MISRIRLKFIGYLTIFLLVVAALSAYPVISYGKPILVKALGACFLFFYLLTILAFVIITRRGQRKVELVNTYLASIGIKMGIGLVLFVVFLFFFKGSEVEFTVSFISGYLICTAFEVYYLLSNLRQISDALENADK